MRIQFRRVKQRNVLRFRDCGSRHGLWLFNFGNSGDFGNPTLHPSAEESATPCPSPYVDPIPPKVTQVTQNRQRVGCWLRSSRPQEPELNPNNLLYYLFAFYSRGIGKF